MEPGERLGSGSWPRLPRLLAGLVVLAFSLVPGSVSLAAELSTTPGPYWDTDPCGPRILSYIGSPGERNQMTVSTIAGIDAPGLTPGPICWSTPDNIYLADPESTISLRDVRCWQTSAHDGRCKAGDFVGLSIVTGDRRDMVKVPAGNPYAVIDAGSGDDAVNVVNGHSLDQVSCGDGADTVSADRGDWVAADCEQVSRFP